MNNKGNLFSTVALMSGISAIISVCIVWFSFLTMPAAIVAILFAMLAVTEGKVDLSSYAKMSISEAIKAKVELVKKMDVLAMIGFVTGSAAIVLHVLVAVINLFAHMTYGFFFFLPFVR